MWNYHVFSLVFCKLCILPVTAKSLLLQHCLIMKKLFEKPLDHCNYLWRLKVQTSSSKVKWNISVFFWDIEVSFGNINMKLLSKSEPRLHPTQPGCCQQMTHIVQSTIKGSILFRKFLKNCQVYILKCVVHVHSCYILLHLNCST